MNSQHRTPNKRLHCIAELRSRAQSMGIADFCRFSSGFSILIKSRAVTQFFCCKKPISAIIFVLICSSFKTEETFCIQYFPLKKKALGKTPSFSNFLCVRQKISQRSCFLIRPSRIYSLFSKDGDKNHQSFVHTCGFCFFFWFSCSADVAAISAL